jgi:hypothetical protein
MAIFISCKLPLKDFLRVILPECDVDETLATLEWDDDEGEDVLPVGDDDGLSSDAEEEESSEDEELEQGYVTPYGFRTMPKPECMAGDVDGLFVQMYWETVGWQLGKAKKYAPQRRRHNYDIVWDEGMRGSMLRLDDYHNVDSSLVGVCAWTYLRKTRVTDETS